MVEEDVRRSIGAAVNESGSGRGGAVAREPEDRESSESTESPERSERTGSPERTDGGPAAKAEVLGRIARALGRQQGRAPALPDGAGLPQPAPPQPAPPPAGLPQPGSVAAGSSLRGEPAKRPRAYRRSADYSGSALVELLAERLADYGAGVHRIRAAAPEETGSPAGGSPAEPVERCGDETVVRAVARVVAEERPVLLPPGLEVYVRELNLEAVVDDGKMPARALDRFPVVLTTCSLAIAETGTIVLDGGAGQGRRALSLVPDHHVCVVESHQIVGSVPEAVRRLDPLRPQTWISGPSATSDIELVRVQGVHGPRRLDVVIVER